MAIPFDQVSKGFPRQVPFHMFHEMKSDAGFAGISNFRDIFLVNWTFVDVCNYHNSAFASNPTSSDSTPVHLLGSITKKDVDEAALIYIDTPNPKWRNFEDCVDMDCTGGGLCIRANMHIIKLAHYRLQMWMQFLLNQLCFAVFPMSLLNTEWRIVYSIQYRIPVIIQNQ